MNNQPFLKSETKEEIYRNTPIKALLPPANPIISKHISQINQRVSFKIENSSPLHEEPNSIEYRNKKTKKQLIVSTQQKEKVFKHLSKKNKQQSDQGTLTDQYDSENLVYKRHDNKKFNTRGNSRYIASIFFPIQSAKSFKLPKYQGVFQDDYLQFDSNFQSANLLAVYKKGQNNYDLLLQNDINSVGFTQWYNFKVQNKKINFVAQFSIVNFYKSHSLYSQGMKPCVLSQKSCKNNKKIWRRKGFNIFYQQNTLSYQDNQNKCYKTLSFQYDFTIQNDCVQFAHAMPYDLQRLKSLLQNLKSNNKVTIKTIGTTLMGIHIPMIKIKSLQKPQSIQKKALIILARQHPGQTVGSFIAEQILLQLLRHSTQIDFLLFRFQIFIFPLVNLDGVIVGNYRSNFAGYDLNRCWLKTDSLKHPQVFAIKSQIKKIKKKQNIELILDLHGHSRKMGSFFYGNTFGNNPMLFPFIASKTNSNVLFEDSKFSVEKASKASTARVVLGNLIKQTGNVYTYEVSFFGNYKNDKNKTFSFNEEHYQELGKALVLSMYRTYMEMYKEEKTLKESIFLKSIKKELQIYKDSVVQNDENSGSDSQAQNAMIEQIKDLQNYYQLQKLSLEHEDNEEILDQSLLLKAKEKKQYKQPIQRRNEEIRNKISELLDKSSNTGQYLEIKGLVKSRLPSIQNKKKQFKQQQLQRELRSLQDSKSQIRKSKNPHKLKVYGQTYQLKSRITKGEYQSIQQKGQLERQISSFKKNLGMKRQLSRQYIRQQGQQLTRSFNTINVLQKSNKDISTNWYAGQAKEIKYKNSSLHMNQISPLFSQQLISDTIKVNKLNNSKIKEHTSNNSALLLQNFGRGIKLPQI